MQRAHQRKCERQFKGNSKAIQRQFKGNSKAIQRQFKGNSKATQRQKKKIEEHKSQKQVKRPGGAIDQAAVS